jgi:molybdate transport system ATP-binding protein
MLEVEIRHRLGDFALDAQFATGPGLVALFGKSGSGKTSIVNVLAGLVHPDHARVTLDGVALVDTVGGVFVPRNKRRIGYVFQDARLLPHLTVRQNLLYGRFFAPPADDGPTLEHVVDLLGIENLLGRRPARLSGGEKQRVAIGRALLAKPKLLLMDEPLASLDEHRKAEILPYIERLRDESRVPIVYVSHSIAEVARLASTMVLLSNGRVAAAGATADVMQRLDLLPLTGRSNAGSLIEATVDRHDEHFGLTTLRSRSGYWRVQQIKAAPGTPVRLRVRARDVLLARTQPDQVSALNVLQGTVAAIGESDGPSVDVRIDCNGDALIARLTRYSVDHLRLASGVPVFALVKSVAFDSRSIGGPLLSAGKDDGDNDDT